MTVSLDKLQSVRIILPLMMHPASLSSASILLEKLEGNLTFLVLVQGGNALREVLNAWWKSDFSSWRRRWYLIVS